MFTSNSYEGLGATFKERICCSLLLRTWTRSWISGTWSNAVALSLKTTLVVTHSQLSVHTAPVPTDENHSVSHKWWFQLVLHFWIIIISCLISYFLRLVIEAQSQFVWAVELTKIHVCPCPGSAHALALWSGQVISISPAINDEEDTEELESFLISSWHMGFIIHQASSTSYTQSHLNLEVMG